MSSRTARSSSVGAVPHKKPLARSRAQSSAASPLEVRCACQFFQSDSLIPERINPIGTNVSRAPSRLGEHQQQKSANCSTHSIIEEEDLNGSVLSFGKTSVPDYYAETNCSPDRAQQGSPLRPLTSPSQLNHPLSHREFANNKENSLPPPSTIYNNNSSSRNVDIQNQPLSFEGRDIPSIEIETFRRDFPIASPPSVYSGADLNLGLIQQQQEEDMDLEFESTTSRRGRMMDRRGGGVREMRESSQPVTMMKNQFNSQKSLDRYSNSVLLNRYRPQSQSQSHAPSLHGSSNDIQFPPKMTKTVSFDYGRPTLNNASGSRRNSAVVNENPNFDQYHCMSPMVFPIRERLQKMEQTLLNNQQQRDHEYEPIGEPQETQPEGIDKIDNEQQKRKVEEGGEEENVDKKFLRTTTVESEDNVSAQDFQDDIENRFFKHEIEPIVDCKLKAPVHQENTFDEAVIIDESPVKREVPKKRNFMSSAQEKSKNLQKRMKASAGALKDSINNKIKKKPKEPIVAVKVTQYDEEEAEVPAGDAAMMTVESQQSSEPIESEAEQKPSKTFNFKVPPMPKFKKISLPDRSKINDRFTKIRQLGRSKSMKDESTADESTSIATQEAPSTAEASNKKKFNFATYPRLIRDKFKRSKLPMERSDMSVRSETPPTSEFTNEQFAKRGPVASRWPEFEKERGSGQYQQFASESSDYDRETSIERRMRMDFDRTTEEREDFAIVARLISEEQRQLNEMEKENQEIHLMAKQERYKKPQLPPRQESSDVASDEWSGMLNRDVSEAEFELQRNSLRIEDEFTGGDINRSYTPQTNQETQSSGSSGHRRRIAMGFDDDDEDYFLRDNNNKLSRDYINHGIQEGLSKVEDNALIRIGKDDENQQEDFSVPDKPIRSLKRKDKKNNEDDFFRTFPPSRPSRKSKQSESDFGNDNDEMLGEEIDLDFRVQGEQEDEFIDDEIPVDEHDMFEYHRHSLKGLEHPDLLHERDDYDNDMMDINISSNLPVPPTPPRRRKKKVRNPIRPVNNFHQNEIILQSKNIMGNNNVNVYRSEPHIAAPLVQEEHFTTPTPTPRRTRSRSNFSSRTLDDAMSFQRDSFEAFNIHDNKENDYAQVRKEFPSRPVRRKQSTKSLGDRLPNFNHEMEDDQEVPPPPRPVRNYSTIPNRPPRRKSAGSLVEISKTIKHDEDDDYEEILGNDKEANNIISERLISGDIVKKMKGRPLPPPPIPKRENKKSKKAENDEDLEDDKFDKDDNAEKINVDALTVETSFDELPEGFEDDQIKKAKEYLPRQDSDFSESERVIEVEVSTQTDPVLDEEFLDDEDEDGLEAYISSDGKVKTLEDILKEEQEAEMERARWNRQLAEAENLAKGIERFRESNQRSFSEKSRTTGGRSRSTSRPITPSAVVVEHRKSSPIICDNVQQTLTEAGLFVHPITYDDYGISMSDEDQLEEREPTSNVAVAEVAETDVNNNFEQEQQRGLDEVDVQEEILTEEIFDNLDQEIEETFERISAEIISGEGDVKESEENIDEEFDAEMQKKIEEMIESVMNSAREEVDWIREREDEENKLKSTFSDDEKIIEFEPEVVEEATTKALEPEKVEKEEEEEEEEIILIEREAIKPFENFKPLEEFKPISPSALENVDEGEKLPSPIPSVEEDEIVQVMMKHENSSLSHQPTPPQPPPRKKSTTTEDFIKIESQILQHLPKIEESHQQTSLVPEETAHKPSPSKPAVVMEEELKKAAEDLITQMPSRLHIDTLEIDNLSVSSLQAGRISASEIDAHSITANELEAKSANLPTVQISPTTQPTFEIPPALIEEIVERVRCASQTRQEPTSPSVNQQQQNEISAPMRPPLPQEYSTIPQSFYHLRDPSDVEQSQKSPPRRRRHHKSISTSEEEYQREQRSKNRGSSSNQSVATLGGQFLQACGRSLRDQGNQLMEILRASSKDENQRDLHVAILILVVIVAGLFLMSYGDKSVHHHHWDFFFPPDNQQPPR